MTPRSTSRQDAILEIATFIKQDGLANTSLRTLADAVGTSDRMLLYYFKDKADIISTVLEHITEEFTQTLAETLPMGKRLPPETIFGDMISLTQTETLKPYMALRLEIMAKAQHEMMPYTQVAKNLTDGFITWLDDRLQIANGEIRHTQAVMILAMIDGLFQVSQSVDAKTFDHTKLAMMKALRAAG